MLPAKEGRDVRQALLDFHEKFYSSEVMALAVLGRESLDDLEAMVRRMFSPVAARQLTPPVFPADPYGDRVGMRQEVVPIKDMRSLYVSWAVPKQRAHYTGKPDRYLSHLVGHEGPGSILSVLKQKGWALGLCGGLMEAQSCFAVFGVSVDLTTDGLDKVDEIVDFIYAYLGLLKRHGPQKWIWDEQADVG